MIRKTVGFVLRGMDYQESDRILSVFTREYGKVSCLAKGARKFDSRFGASLDALTLSELIFYDGRGLKLLKDASVLESFSRVKKRYDLLSAALRAARLLYLLLEEGHAEREVFGVFHSWLAALAHERERTLPVFELGFRLKLLQALGVGPRWRHCARCGKDPHEFWFSPPAGGVVCGDCHRARDFPAERGLALSLQRAAEVSWTQLRRLDIRPAQLTLAEKWLDAFIEVHLRPVAQRSK